VLGKERVAAVIGWRAQTAGAFWVWGAGLLVKWSLMEGCWVAGRVVVWQVVD
jgi:hypothetical protein